MLRRVQFVQAHGEYGRFEIADVPSGFDDASAAYAGRAGESRSEAGNDSAGFEFIGEFGHLLDARDEVAGNL